jgi:hypothetical protein
VAFLVLWALEGGMYSSLADVWSCNSEFSEIQPEPNLEQSACHVLAVADTWTRESQIKQQNPRHFLCRNLLINGSYFPVFKHSVNSSGLYLTVRAFVACIFDILVDVCSFLVASSSSRFWMTIPCAVWVVI